MQKTPLPFQKSDASLTLLELERHARDWLLDGEIRQLSKQTLATRQFLLDKLLWFMRQRELDCCGTAQIRGFLAYATTGHEKAGGRWGNPQMQKAVRPVTIQTYHAILRAFFRFLIAEGVLPDSPMGTIRPPVVQDDQVQPFTTEELDALLEAARKSRHRRRDEAIVLFLLDTGCRASEVCGLRVSDLDFQARRCTVLGKGKKTRSVFFGRDTTRALWAYLKEEGHEGSQALFLSDRGTSCGDGLTRWGLLQLIERLGKAARIENARCSPHTFRHTFAVSFLRNGGNVFTLKELLGHRSLKMVNRYVALAQADIQNQHRQFSPVDCRKRK